MGTHPLESLFLKAAQKHQPCIVHGPENAQEDNTVISQNEPGSGIQIVALMDSINWSAFDCFVMREFSFYRSSTWSQGDGRSIFQRRRAAQDAAILSALRASIVIVGLDEPDPRFFAAGAGPADGNRRRGRRSFILVGSREAWPSAPGQVHDPDSRQLA
jgi:hypothetical protein